MDLHPDIIAGLNRAIMRKLIFSLSFFWHYQPELRPHSSMISCSKTDASWIPRLSAGQNQQTPGGYTGSIGDTSLSQICRES